MDQGLLRYFRKILGVSYIFCRHFGNTDEILRVEYDVKYRISKILVTNNGVNVE